MIATKNRVRRGFYADSVALMRIARELGRQAGVLAASLMIGTPSNKALLADAGLLAGEGKDARPDDLIVAVKAQTPAQAKAALDLAEKVLMSGTGKGDVNQDFSTVSSLACAMAALPAANLALISVPGEYAAAEARSALERGLHVMMFSDNVPVEDEIALKDLAAKRGLLLMGPDCGTALIGGVPIAFANAVPRGDTGIVSASGTGLQEVSTLLARQGRGVSHGIGVGGRDLSEEVGGRMTLAALDALEADPATRRIIVISKPPAPSVTMKIAARAAKCGKPVVLCLLGSKKISGDFRFARILEEVVRIRTKEKKYFHRKVKGGVRGLFCGGTLCAEAQIVLMDHGLKVSSNVPVPGATETGAARNSPHVLLDLGDDEYTRGRPHPMIEPALRNEFLERALREKGVGVILLDVVIGYGAHADPAGLIADAVRKTKKLVIASVTGTESDPQVYSRQVKTLESAGVVIAESNAQAARIAASAILRPVTAPRGKPSPARRPRRSAPRSRSR